jgi:two-component system, LuxR family, sensor histidine kinase DctS
MLLMDIDPTLVAPPPAAAAEAPARAPAAPGVAPRWTRALLWTALVATVALGQAALLWFTWQYESTRTQERVDEAALTAAADVRQLLAADVQALQALVWNDPQGNEWRAQARALLSQRREVARIELRDAQFAIVRAETSPYHAALFKALGRSDMDTEAGFACAAAQRLATPVFSRSYFVPLPGGVGQEVIDLCIPRLRAGVSVGSQVTTLVLADVLERGVGPTLAAVHEISLVEADGTRLARTGLQRGARVYVAERLIDLPGLTLPLRVDSSATAPRLVPNLATALVLGLSLALTALLWLLARDVRRRAAAERGLAEALAFRKAMEDSLVTGLRARDLQGRISYVNPAFCDMVGFSSQELLGSDMPPYWPPELVPEYTQRQTQRLAGDTPPREGFETVFMRRSGERFPVRIFEAPLVDGTGARTGWMSAVVDVSEQRRVEDLSRQQQEKLQATARLATMGEMASLLSHELNQPLAAIASYATGSLNLLPADAAAAPADAPTQQMIRQALQRMAEQADRAGRVIKSVHDFVRRREHLRERVRADQLLDAVMPLVRLAARKSGTRIELDLPETPPSVVCDRTMIEQVLLNLARNAIQAMEEHTVPEQRVLTLRVRASTGAHTGTGAGEPPRTVDFSVIDCGPGITAQVAERLFTPFFTTKPEGMGMGLSLCRTVIEQHGGTLVHLRAPDEAGGAEFRFTLAAAKGS